MTASAVTFTTQRALLKAQEPYIKSRVWFFSRRGLPPMLEQDDLYQVGMIAATRCFERSGWVKETGPMLPKAIDGAMIDEINRARTGVKRPVEGFAMVPFSELEGDDEFNLLEVAAEAFSFESAPLTPPSDPDCRLRIYQAASGVLSREYPISTRYENVRAVRQTESGSWEATVELMNFKCVLGSLPSRKAAAKAKYDLLCRIRDSVLPIDPTAPGRVGKPKNKFSRLAEKAKALEFIAGRRTSAVLPRSVGPKFVYDDPLYVMLILERMCLLGTDDWTALNDVVPGVA